MTCGEIVATLDRVTLVAREKRTREGAAHGARRGRRRREEHPRDRLLRPEARGISRQYIRRRRGGLERLSAAAPRSRRARHPHAADGWTGAVPPAAREIRVAPDRLS